jgi:hypothetical protein
LAPISSAIWLVLPPGAAQRSTIRSPAWDREIHHHALALVLHGEEPLVEARHGGGGEIAVHLDGGLVVLADGGRERHVVEALEEFLAVGLVGVDANRDRWRGIVGFEQLPGFIQAETEEPAVDHPLRCE